MIRAGQTRPKATAWTIALAIVVVSVLPTRLKEEVNKRKQPENKGLTQVALPSSNPLGLT